jgi:hypothetical protein
VDPSSLLFMAQSAVIEEKDRKQKILERKDDE